MGHFHYFRHGFLLQERTHHAGEVVCLFLVGRRLMAEVAGIQDVHLSPAPQKVVRFNVPVVDALYVGHRHIIEAVSMSSG